VTQLPPGQVGFRPPPRRSPLMQKARGAISFARKGVVRVLGEDQTARLFHPIKVGLRERREVFKRLVPNQVQDEVQRQMRRWRPDNQPLLRASHVQERLILDGVPVELERPSSPRAIASA